MDFDKYNYMLAVADTRSITKAAKKCFISQPSLTRCITKEEEELGVKLFDRSKTPLELTYAGERYIAAIRNLCALKYALDKEMEEIAQMKKGRLVIGIPTSRGNTWLPHILPIFQAKCPGIDLRLVEGTSGELEERLVKEDIDLLVVATLPFEHAGLEFELVRNEQLMIVLPADWDLFEGKELCDDPRILHYIDADMIKDKPFVSGTPDQGLTRVANQVFSSLNIRPEVLLETGNTTTAYHLTAEGMGFCFSPVNVSYEQLVEKTPVFCTLYDPPLERSIVVAYKKGRPVSAASRQFIDIVKHQAVVCPAIQGPQFRVVYDVCPNPLSE